MNITILKNNLAEGLALVSRAATARSTLPVLNNILLATEGPRLRLSATDLTIAITTWLDATVEADGAITVPAKTLIEVVTAIAAGDSLSLTLDHETLTVMASGLRTQIKGLCPDEFPLLPRGDTQSVTPIEMDIAALRNAIGKTSCCAATTEVRPVLTGVHFKARKGQAAFAATDGFRLSVVQMPIGPADLAIIIPASSLNQLERILGEEGTVVVRVPEGGNQIIFSAINLEMVSQLIDGKYPDYEQIIPSDAKIVAEVDAAELFGAVKAMDVFARDNQHVTQFTFEDNQLNLVGQSAETGSGTSTVPIRLGTSKTRKLPLGISFNAKFVMDALKGCDGACRIHLKDALSPALFTPCDQDNLRMVIMPVRTR